MLFIIEVDIISNIFRQCIKWVGKKRRCYNWLFKAIEINSLFSIAYYNRGMNYIQYFQDIYKMTWEETQMLMMII